MLKSSEVVAYCVANKCNAYTYKPNNCIVVFSINDYNNLETRDSCFQIYEDDGEDTFGLDELNEYVYKTTFYPYTTTNELINQQFVKYALIKLEKAHKDFLCKK